MRDSLLYLHRIFDILLYENYDVYYLSPTTLRSRSPDDVATYRS